MKKGIFLFIVLTNLVFSAKTIPLPDLKKPVRIEVDRDGIYINDSMAISTGKESLWNLCRTPGLLDLQ